MGWTDLTTRIQEAGQTIFGETVTYTPTSGTPETVTGIFDAEHHFQEVIGETVIETSRPRLVVRSASLSTDPVRTNTVAVRGVTYTVLEVQPDGQGDIELILEKV